MLWAVDARHVEVFVKHLCRNILCEYVRWVVVCADFCGLIGSRFVPVAV